MMIRGRILALFMTLFLTTASAQYLYPPGEKAHDFEGVTVDGRAYHLFDSKAEHIIICFWAVDCDNCHDFLKSLRRHLDLKNDYELVTFALADNPRQVQKKARRMRLTGWHFIAEERWNSQPFLDYDVTFTPTAVLIDKDKNIIGEAYDWEEFEELKKENGERNGEALNEAKRVKTENKQTKQ